MLYGNRLKTIKETNNGYWIYTCWVVFNNGRTVDNIMGQEITMPFPHNNQGEFNAANDRYLYMRESQGPTFDDSRRCHYCDNVITEVDKYTHEGGQLAHRSCYKQAMEDAADLA